MCYFRADNVRFSSCFGAGHAFGKIIRKGHGWLISPQKTGEIGRKGVCKGWEARVFLQKVLLIRAEESFI